MKSICEQEKFRNISAWTAASMKRKGFRSFGMVRKVLNKLGEAEYPLTRVQQKVIIYTENNSKKFSHLRLLIQWFVCIAIACMQTGHWIATAQQEKHCQNAVMQ